MLAILEDALRGRHRQVSLAQWVERTWITLGGRACVDRAGYANVQAFFAMLEQLGPEASGLEDTDRRTMRAAGSGGKRTLRRTAHDDP